MVKYKEFLIIFKGLSASKICPRLESASLITNAKSDPYTARD